MFTWSALDIKHLAYAVASRISRASVLVLLVAGVSCTPEPEPLRIERSTLSIDNRSDADWQDVEIWLNDHYRVSVTSIPAGSRFDAPLNSFVEGFGRRFDPARQSPSGIEVSVREGSERKVKMVWGKGRRQ
jgi:hypothetical protein